jgi:septum formation inhibitor MinC
MSQLNKRYIFVDYENLKKVNIKKLEKVSERIFIFLPSGVDKIPFSLVKNLQKLGRMVKWIQVQEASAQELDFPMAFTIGNLHQEVSEEIEFAIIGNDARLDSLVQFINQSGRSALRVKNEPEISTHREDGVQEPIVEKTNNPVLQQEMPAVIPNPTPSNHSNAKETIAEKTNSKEGISKFPKEGDQFVDETAKDVIKRLIRSGNRPSELTMLKNYILMSNPEKTVHDNIDFILQKMSSINSITIEGEDIVYHF